MNKKIIIVASVIIGSGAAVFGYFMTDKGPASYSECVLEYGRGIDSGLGRIDVWDQCRTLFPESTSRTTQRFKGNPFIDEQKVKPDLFDDLIPKAN